MAWIKPQFLRKKVKAFTLTELLVVLCIVGILILLAVPNLMPLISKTKATEAQLQLAHVYTLQKSYFYLHSKYSEELNEINYEHEKLVTNDGKANYLIEIADASTNGFKARATAVVDFDGDGIFDVWEIDQENSLKQVTKD